MSFSVAALRGRAAAAFAIMLGVCAARAASPMGALEQTSPPGGERPPPVHETRALWVLRTSLTNPRNIATLVASAREHGFNTLLVQVRGRGDAYYLGGIEPRPADLRSQLDTFDPLEAVIEQARAAGLRVHAWVNVNLVSSAADLPTARAHVVYRHPAWLMVPRDIAQELAAIEPGNPSYIGKLARWTRTHSAEAEGLYSSPIIPAAAEYTEAVVRNIARRYAIDGIHFDYTRYPSDRFDYSRAAVREFRSAVRPRLAAATRRTLDAEDAVDLFAYPDALPTEWRSFRIARLTALVGRLQRAVKTERPQALVTVAAGPDRLEAYNRRLQDWGAWLDAGFIDAICPMAYTTEPELFAEQISAAREAAGSHAVWAGIGAYRLSPSVTIENILTARRLGAKGVVLFSYDSLTNPQQPFPDYLLLVRRGAFAVPPPARTGAR
jgi:uncharacterized lipoprotein YddW (UPF0748 family)